MTGRTIFRWIFQRGVPRLVILAALSVAVGMLTSIAGLVLFVLRRDPIRVAAGSEPLPPLSILIAAIIIACAGVLIAWLALCGSRIASSFATVYTIALGVFVLPSLEWEGLLAGVALVLGAILLWLPVSRRFMRVPSREDRVGAGGGVSASRASSLTTVRRRSPQLVILAALFLALVGLINLAIAGSRITGLGGARYQPESSLLLVVFVTLQVITALSAILLAWRALRGSAWPGPLMIAFLPAQTLISLQSVSVLPLLVLPSIALAVAGTVLLWLPSSRRYSNTSKLS